MGRAKEIEVRPIPGRDANRIVRALHYSGKVTQNSQVHLGVFLGGRCGGAMQLGPSIDKRRMQPLVRGTAWDGFLELNRMAFADWLPRNSESRALGVMRRLLRTRYPQLEWVVSFADACQCGDGTIYRAAGFLLVGIKHNTNLLRMPDGRVRARKSLDDHRHEGGRYGSAVARDAGAVPLAGHQIKYLLPLNDTVRGRLTVPVLPYSRIAEVGASMYRGRAPEA